jgi:TatA/E family protein of Tat protein translocase
LPPVGLVVIADRSTKRNLEIIAMPFLREPTHLLLVLLVLILLFGAKRLPDSARSLAKSLRIFKSEMKDINKDEEKKDGEGGAEK